MSIQLAPLALPASADPAALADLGREVKGVHPAELTPAQFAEIEAALYKHSILLFRNVALTPEQQFALTEAFDPARDSHGHGASTLPPSSILHYLQRIPRVPQVMLIGHGTLADHEGLSVTLQHPSHRATHKTPLADADEARGDTRFCRWHIDAALYGLHPPRVTTLYGIRVPQGPPQTVRYDDGPDTLPVPLGATAFVSGTIMFAILPAPLKSLAVRTAVRYAPHPYTWMAPARAKSTGLGLETEGREVPLEDLPAWDESKVQTLPALWKNPITGALSMQVHAWCARELIVQPLPAGASRDGALYPDGAHIRDLAEIRALLYKMQRPAIAPRLVYPHNWQEKDLLLFHNRGLIHTTVGVFKPGQVRVFHQCNLAASDSPAGPTEDDILRWTQ